MKKILIVIILSLIVSNLFIFLITSYKPLESKYRYLSFQLGQDLGSNVGGITNGKSISQYFTVTNEGLSGVEIFFSTFNRKNAGVTKVEIIDFKNNKLLRSVILNNSQLKDNNYQKISFPVIRGVEKIILCLKIYSDVEEDNAITVWKDNKTISNSRLEVNGTEVDGTLVVKLVYEKLMNIYSYLVINFTIIMLNLFIFTVIRFLKRGSL